MPCAGEAPAPVSCARTATGSSSISSSDRLRSWASEVAGPAIVAALRRAGGELVPQPPRDIVVEPGDVLIVMGTDETIDRLEALFTPERRS